MNNRNTGLIRRDAKGLIPVVEENVNNTGIEPEVYTYSSLSNNSAEGAAMMLQRKDQLHMNSIGDADEKEMFADVGTEYDALDDGYTNVEEKQFSEEAITTSRTMQKKDVATVAANATSDAQKKLSAQRQAAEKLANQKQQTVQSTQSTNTANSQPVQANTQTNAQANTQAAAPKTETKAAPKPASNTQTAVPKLKMDTKVQLDAMSKAYSDAFTQHFGVDLSSSMCFENIRKLCEINVKDPAKSLYLVENTYRVTTLMYLATNLPIIFVATVLAEKNRVNVLKYVTQEVEHSNKKYEELKAFRLKRWMDKYANMEVNDAMTVTLSVTNLMPEIVETMYKRFEETCVKLKRFNKELSDLVSKFDDNVKTDVVYIYSNFWYFLQGFENNPEMRTYVMAITDDTRKNLKM